MTRQVAQALLVLYGISGVNHNKTPRQASISYFGKTGEEFDAIFTLASTGEIS